MGVGEDAVGLDERGLSRRVPGRGEGALEGWRELGGDREPGEGGAEPLRVGPVLSRQEERQAHQSPGEPGGDQSGTEVVADLGGASDEGFLLADAVPLAGQQPSVHLRGEPGEQRPHLAEFAVGVGVHLPAGGLEQGLLRKQQPIQRGHAGARVEAEVVVQPVGECADPDVMLDGDTVPAESHGPPAELLGQARIQVAAHRVDVGWATNTCIRGPQP